MLTISRSRLITAATVLIAAFIFLIINVGQAAANPGITIEKHTNGEDADEPTGPEIPVGDPVLWEYIVTNTGNIDLANIVVTDDQGVDVSCPQSSLSVGETMTCTGNGVAEAGQYANLGCVEVFRRGEVILTDCDPSHYTNPPGTPAIDISKQAEGPDSRTFASGSDVPFTITVTNTGDVDLSNVEVTDIQAPGCGMFIGDLAVGASSSYTCTVPNVTESFDNEACVEGESNGITVNDCDPSSVEIEVEVISIDIRKQVEGPDSRTFVSGSDVPFEIVVTNDGPFDLSNVEVTDLVNPSCNMFIGDLAAGASTTYTCTEPNVTENFDSEACVIGERNGASVDDCDPSSVEVIAIDIRKQVEGPDSRTFVSGSDVPFEIVVTNTGPSDLSNVEVTDLVNPSCNMFIGDLAAGASTTYTCTEPNVTENFDSEACVIGGRNGVSVDDCDPASVEVIAIDIRKQVEGPDSRSFSPGSDVPFEIVVTNTGPTDLSNVEVTDQVNPSCAMFIGDLAAGDSFTYTCTEPNVTESFDSEACVVGEQDGVFASDCDPSSVVIAGIDIEKYTLVQPSGSTGTDLCETYGKPAILTLIYTGDGNDATSHSQDSSKVNVTGDPNDEAVVQILVTDKENPDDSKAKTFFDGIVNLDDNFVIDAGFAGESKLKAKTFVFIYDLDGNLLQFIEFHTSCSQPLFLGNQFGAVQLVGFVDENGAGDALSTTPSGDLGEDADVPTGPSANIGDTIVWNYVVTNQSSTALADVTVMDDNGTPDDPSDDFTPTAVSENGINVGDINGDGLLDSDETWFYTASGTAQAGQYANIGDVSGTPVDELGNPIGDPVTDSDPSHYFGQFPQTDLCETYGKPAILTMLYTGDGDDATSHSQDSSKVSVTGDPNDEAVVQIVVTDKENPDDNKAKVFFDGIVNLGDSFVIDAAFAGENKLKSKTFVFIYDLDGNLLQSIEFHTSCSQPLFLGDQFGAVQLTGFVDEDGQGPGDGSGTGGTPTGTDMCETYGKPALLTMLYTGDGDDATSHSQDGSKVNVMGDPNDEAVVQILVTDKENPDDNKAKVFFDGIVNLGDSFVIDAGFAGENKLQSKTFVFIYDLDGNLLQSIEFHTSCSQPLFLGDQFGGVQLVGFLDENGNGENLP